MFWKRISSISNLSSSPLPSKRKEEDAIVSLLASFLGQPEHQWIRQNKVLQDRIVELFTKLPQKDLEKFVLAKRGTLAYSDGKWSCTFSKGKTESVILIFPNLYRLFLSAEFPQTQAILAHEIGHVLLDHNEKRKSEAELQMEADAYAKSLGFGQELLYALQEFPATKELVRRAEKLAGR